MRTRKGFFPAFDGILEIPDDNGSDGQGDTKGLKKPQK